jgi:tetratricopeptide (TPR) repeat protein
MNSVDQYFDAANRAELDGRYAEANSFYDKVLELQPDYPEALDNRAGNWMELGEYSKAIADYKKVLSYWPDYSGANDNLAQIYLNADEIAFHNETLALEHARRACELCQFSDFRPISTFAAALAANNDFGKAISMQQKAIEAAAKEIEYDFWIHKLKEQLTEYCQKRHEQKQTGWLSRIAKIFKK